MSLALQRQFREEFMLVIPAFDNDLMRERFYQQDEVNQMVDTLLAEPSISVWEALDMVDDTGLPMDKFAEEVAYNLNKFYQGLYG